jgi:hypothetical protein
MDYKGKTEQVFKSTGRIITEQRFMFLECDKNIAEYYRYLARIVGINLILQRHDCHISVVRTEELKHKYILPTIYDFEEVEFCGNPEYMQFNDTHYWFRIISPRLEEIRMELGFCSQPVETISNGVVYTHPFHLTIGRISRTC